MRYRRELRCALLVAFGLTVALAIPGEAGAHASLGIDARVVPQIGRAAILTRSRSSRGPRSGCPTAGPTADRSQTPVTRASGAPAPHALDVCQSGGAQRRRSSQSWARLPPAPRGCRLASRAHEVSRPGSVAAGEAVFQDAHAPPLSSRSA